jgi:hypothetical protein
MGKSSTVLDTKTDVTACLIELLRQVKDGGLLLTYHPSQGRGAENEQSTIHELRARVLTKKELGNVAGGSRQHKAEEIVNALNGAAEAVQLPKSDSWSISRFLALVECLRNRDKGLVLTRSLQGGYLLYTARAVGEVSSNKEQVPFAQLLASYASKLGRCPEPFVGTPAAND